MMLELEVSPGAGMLESRGGLSHICSIFQRRGRLAAEDGAHTEPAILEESNAS
ncbi:MULTISPECIES: hypothetical protein [Acetobacteraceae]|uniref:Uncharacterized protein n=1 Tax=Parasaccharibacter apium TaxID=1510841 RepID=A0A7U7J0T8_9PROT|nr:MULTISPECIES: hypothetical protein [Acetobacteraceae]CDG33397.1 hypothetical protein SACS_0659 [Parasaccharibacter apium]